MGIAKTVSDQMERDNRLWWLLFFICLFLFTAVFLHHYFDKHLYVDGVIKMLDTGKYSFRRNPGAVRKQPTFVWLEKVDDALQIALSGDSGR